MKKWPIAIAVVLIAGLAVVFAPSPGHEAEAQGQGETAQQSPAAAQAAAEAAGVALETEQQKVSYSLGVDVGSSLRQQGLDIQPDLFVRGFRDGLTGAQPLLTEQQRMQTLMAFQQKLRQERQQEQAQAAESNLQNAKEFLEENKDEEGIKTTESGLQYKVVEEGTGQSPVAEDTVRVHYRGTLLNGSEFDSSYSRGEPTEFQVGQVIPGWREAVKMMKVGGHWKLWVPPDLAYGEQGVPPAIGPNELLIFDVKLLDIVENGGKEAAE